MLIRTLLRLAFAASALTVSATASAAGDSLSTQLAIERARPAAARIDRERFPSDPSLGSVTLSPDGRSIAFVRIAGDRRSLWLLPTKAGAAPHRLLARIDGSRLEWSPDSRWLFLVSDKEVRLLSLASEPGSGVITKLGGRNQMKLVGFDRLRPAALLIDRKGDSWRLWSMGPGGRPRLLAYSRRQIVDAVAGRDGRAAMVKLVEEEHHLLLARGSAGRFRPVAACVRIERCDLLGPTPDGRGTYLSSDKLGDRRGLVRLDVDGDWLALDDDPAGFADVDAVLFDRQAGSPEFALYRSGATRLSGLTDRGREGLKRLPLHSIVDVETSPGPWLVREEGSQLQGARWHLFDPRTGRSRAVLDDQQDRLPEASLARTVAFIYPASDGMRIHGLLTVPPGCDLAGAPLVTLVHGGPWAHDEIEYSSLLQLFANRGYVVFQPQFRGSTGFGRRYLFAANGDYGDGRVQRDIEDGTRYLLARRIGDPRRTAIMGASFGGYSTLQALSNGSRLYGAGIAIVPPTDFGWIIDWAADRNDLGENQGVRFAAVQKVLGLDRADPRVVRRLHSQSPRARAGAMKTPLLLIAAGRDERVPIRSVIAYAADLKVRRAPATIIVGTRLAHSNRSLDGLKASLFLAEDMLQRQWGGPPAAPPSGPIKRWMAANFKPL